MKSEYRNVARALNLYPMTKSEICAHFDLEDEQAESIIQRLYSDKDVKIISFGKFEGAHYYVEKFSETVYETLLSILKSCPGDKFTIVELSEIIKCEQCSVRRAISSLLSNPYLPIKWDVKPNKHGTKEYWFEPPKDAF
ncbi:hypothetical protein [Vibrio harveyi]|uniref:hypothetical protein n=1 Tax=Vibrio harveyi TaxID=669 RepID=UPI00131CD745|nr:hypothetical protein [Vibrio harveyi]